MKARELYSRLAKDFILPGLTDDWGAETAAVADMLADRYKERWMGVVCDFTPEVKRVFSAVFASETAMRKALASGAEDALLFVHHPAAWDIRRAPEVFQAMDRRLLEEFKERRIAIYNLHVPLDNYGPYSTSVRLAEAVGIRPEKAFGEYHGALAGVLGRTDYKTITELKVRFEQAVGHKVVLYAYGDDDIKGELVAVTAGGGLNETIEAIVGAGAKVLVTGITAKSDHSRAAHRLAERNGVSLLGGTHYSTEKFACQALVGYFSDLGVPAEFVSDDPVREDM
jgi:putative NIF3 family GTP cyclohydrolase 1 type 2